MSGNQTSSFAGGSKFCVHCGEKILKDAVICIHCGRQVEKLESTPVQPNIVINNTNAGYACARGPYNKWIAFALCFFLGFFGAHKFYENKPGMGILYFFTAGLFVIG